MGARLAERYIPERDRVVRTAAPAGRRFHHSGVDESDGRQSRRSLGAHTSTALERHVRAQRLVSHPPGATGNVYRMPFYSIDSASFLYGAWSRDASRFIPIPSDLFNPVRKNLAVVALA